MNEKYFLGLGSGLILVSFGIIISYFVFSGVETRAAQENKTISFEQLQEEINQLTPEKLKDTTVIQKFRSYVGETVEDLKEKAVLENSTLHSELKNRLSTNKTT